MLEMKDRIVRNAYGRLKRFTQFLILCRSQHGGFDTFGFHVIAFSLVWYRLAIHSILAISIRSSSVFFLLDEMAFIRFV